MSMVMYCNQDELNKFQKDFSRIGEIELFGRSFFVKSWSYTTSPWQPETYKVLFDLEESHKKVMPKPKSEEELQLEQVIKLTKQDISHKERLIEQYEAKRVELERKRLENT